MQNDTVQAAAWRVHLTDNRAGEEVDATWTYPRDLAEARECAREQVRIEESSNAGHLAGEAPNPGRRRIAVEYSDGEDWWVHQVVYECEYPGAGQADVSA